MTKKTPRFLQRMISKTIRSLLKQACPPPVSNTKTQTPPATKKSERS